MTVLVFITSISIITNALKKLQDTEVYHIHGFHTKK